MALTCYLDDSDHIDHPAVTMAGYVASDKSWALFEERTGEYLRKHKIASVHAMDFENHKGEFKGWAPPERMAFLAGLCAILRTHVILGVSVATYKDAHRQAKARTGRGQNQSPYGQSFTATQDLLLKDTGIRNRLRAERLSYVIEAGNKNNAGILRSFEAIKKEHNLSQIDSMTFAKKNSTIALQMADVLSFYTRRHVAAMDRSNRQQVEYSPALKVLTGCGIHYIGRASTGFD